ncbi:transposase, Mutator family protein [Rhodococcus sp. MTM3W5.2]|nr:transposase, Mutator family protein [Rhodococcus sp. MTM3W5.2]
MRDALEGLSDTVTTAWDPTVVQTSVIQLIHRTFRYASRKSGDEMNRDVEPFPTAPS